MRGRRCTTHRKIVDAYLERTGGLGKNPLVNEMDASTDNPTGPTSDDEKSASEQFLCEQCGYSLEGLDAMGCNCPECGKPARESLPSARVGTPWQIKPGPISYVWTVYLVLTHPRTIWKDVRLERAHGRSLMCVSLVLTGLVGTGLMLTGLGGLGYMASFAFFFTLAMAVLTSIEQAGLRVFGSRRGFRMKGNVPLVICAHAAAGWWVSVAGMVLVTRSIQVMVIGQLPGSGWIEGVFLIYGWSVPKTVVFVVGAFVVGMVCYSLLAGAGFHRLRYVNKPGIEQDSGAA